jgi:phosphate:Na+ symporter
MELNGGFEPKDAVQTLLNFLASVALLVWGTHIVRSGVLRVFGADLRRVLSRSVGDRFSAFLAGLGVTSIVQSSSATALIASSFVSQSLIGLPAALAIMLGADVGTALMAQLFSLDLSWLSPLLILFGVIFFLSRRDSRAGQIGRIATGLGLMLLALQLVMAATRPITEAHGVRVLFGTLSGDTMLDMLIGAAMVMISFSSLAIVLLCATLAASKVVAVPVALSLVLGANLGSGLLALVVNARTAGGGRRLAFGNLLFKALGCVAFATALGEIEPLIAHFDANVRRQILDFHVIFNVALAAVFLGLTEFTARLVEHWVPVGKDKFTQAEPRFLDPAALTTPALALANAARETLRIGDTIEQMLDGMLEVMRGGDAERVGGIIRLDDDVDRLYTAVKLYLTQISRGQLDERDSRRWQEIISLTINLEHVGDILEHILLDLRDKMIAHRLAFSEAGLKEITGLHERLVANLRLGLSVFLNGDVAMAQQLIAAKERFRDLERAYHDTHLDRLAGQSMAAIETSSLHLDIISDMRRINSFFCSTAYPILEREGKLRRSRLLGATGAYAARPDLAAGSDVPSPSK